MTYHGQIRNGRIALPQADLREGTVVAVQLAARGSAPRRRARPKIMKYAGVAKGLPSDASRNLDHYLYGHPKR